MKASPFATPASAATIVCLTYFDAGDVDAIWRHDITPTVFNDAGVALLNDAAPKQRSRPRVWVKVDTGLGRLGVPADEAAAFIDGILRDTPLEIAGIYSTLAERGDGDARQLARLLALRERLPALARRRVEPRLQQRHPDDAGGCLDVVRPGVMLLGFPPSEPERMDAERLAVGGSDPNRHVEDPRLQPEDFFRRRAGGLRRSNAPRRGYPGCRLDDWLG